jgi:hypothetical protein
MSRIKNVTAALLVASFVSLQPVAALADGGQRGYGYDDSWDRREAQRDREERRDRREERRDRRDRYDRSDRWDRGYGDHDGWDPVPYYRRDDRRYRARRLGRYDVVYRGSDNRYYCRRDDGTTGLIVGGIAGGLLGNVIAPRRSRTLGTIIGASAGAIIGRSIDDGNVVCR